MILLGTHSRLLKLQALDISPILYVGVGRSGDVKGTATMGEWVKVRTGYWGNGTTDKRLTIADFELQLKYLMKFNIDKEYRMGTAFAEGFLVIDGTIPLIIKLQNDTQFLRTMTKKELNRATTTLTSMPKHLYDSDNNYIDFFYKNASFVGKCDVFKYHNNSGNNDKFIKYVKGQTVSVDLNSFDYGHQNFGDYKFKDRDGSSNLQISSKIEQWGLS